MTITVMRVVIIDDTNVVIRVEHLLNSHARKEDQEAGENHPVMEEG